MKFLGGVEKFSGVLRNIQGGLKFLIFLGWVTLSQERLRFFTRG